MRYELRPVPTPGVTDMRFVLSGRELHYFNQKEEWIPFEWSGDTLENNSHIEWQTEQGGLRSALEMPGRFGLIRLLERAVVSQQDNARYLLTWKPDAKEVPHSEAGESAWQNFDEGTPLDGQRQGKRVTPVKDGSAEQQVTAPGLGTPVRVQLRSEAGAGPLDVLALRHFTLPARISVTASAKGARQAAQSSPPPLPPGALAAAKRAMVPLPQGALAELQ